ncbi:hypothetical protein ACJIZ3_022899 [Penstemon smallii]|uniref:Uncharacterized protein n=1 Tax=Penstemon smallii TaxID=265156 RepID=A0ABD3TQH0_9LAMI
MQVISLLLCPLVQLVQCQQQVDIQNGINSSQLDNPTVLNQFTELIYQRLSSVTSDLIHSEIAQRAAFCVTDPEDDWNRSFNYSDNLDFLSRCIVTTREKWQNISLCFYKRSALPPSKLLINSYHREFNCSLFHFTGR